MNRQAITFFSLFSLILVLSVYYVMIPPVNYETNDDTQEVSLQDVLDEKRDNINQLQTDILSSSESSGQQISDALESLSENKTATSVEQKVKNALNEIGYTSVFCEIDGSIIKVSISKNGATSEDAIKVMECVMKTCNEKYSPEIKFVTE